MTAMEPLHVFFKRLFGSTVSGQTGQYSNCASTDI